MKFTANHCLHVAFALLIMPFISGCEKLVTVPPPQRVITATAVFSNDADATGAVLGIYSGMMNNKISVTNGAMSLYGGLGSDDLTIPGEDPFFSNKLAADNVLCKIFFDLNYSLIYQCNDVLEKLPDASVSNDIGHELTGEAKFSRAFLYFYLINLYGDVPLVMNTHYTENALMARTPTDMVYRQIIADLNDARAALPAEYLAMPGYERDRTRPNRAAATALLSRVYLYRQDWANAAHLASLLIEDSVFQLESDLTKVFLADSQETIWALQPLRGNNYTAEASWFIPKAGVPPTYFLSNWLINNFEQDDLRLKFWAGLVNNGTPYYYPAKYRAVDTSAKPKEYNIVLRLAEQYLIRAEARAQQGDTIGALQDLNSIRRRAGLLDRTGMDVAELLTAIQQQRQVEFFAEWGHRWLDLKRTGTIDSILSKEKPGWRHAAALYPIPENDIKYDPSLTQNPEY